MIELGAIVPIIKQREIIMFSSKLQIHINTLTATQNVILPFRRKSKLAGRFIELYH
jgi:hypothetical protein